LLPKTTTTTTTSSSSKRRQGEKTTVEATTKATTVNAKISSHDDISNDPVESLATKNNSQKGRAPEQPVKDHGDSDDKPEGTTINDLADESVVQDQPIQEQDQIQLPQDDSSICNEGDDTNTEPATINECTTTTPVKAENVDDEDNETYPIALNSDRDHSSTPSNDDPKRKEIEVALIEELKERLQKGLTEAHIEDVPQGENKQQLSTINICTCGRHYTLI